MTDEEAVVMAAMAGMVWRKGTGEVSCNLIYPIDPKVYEICQNNSDDTGRYGFASVEALSHAYCRYYKLGSYTDD